MAKIETKEKAINFRKKGMSYSQIKELTGVSKSTLSLWLQKYPLSKERISELRDNNPIRIEKFRNTMSLKKNVKLNSALKTAKEKLGKFSERDLLIAGIFLYFGEGSKTTKNTTALTNTNPVILKYFIKWLELHNVDRKKIKIKLHLYKDMDSIKIIKFWCNELKISQNQIRGPYIKNSKQSDITYKNSFGYGTCTIIFENSELCNLTMAYLKYSANLLNKY